MSKAGYGLSLLILSLATAAAAQEAVPTGRQIARACSGDVARFCPEVDPGGGRLKACMKEHAAQLSATCFDTLLGAVSVIYTLDSDMLFPPGGWQLSEAGKGAIAGIVRKLAPTQEHMLYVSGFSDSTPVGPELAAQGITSNLILSQRRADEVMHFLISQGVNPTLVVAKGFGDADPVASNATPEGRARNRRVEFSLNPL